MQYKMIVPSNYTEGMKDEYLEWYAGQHFHDLLRIPGFKGAQFFKVTEAQQTPQHSQVYSYYVIWDWETDDLQSVIDDVNERIKDGRTVFSAAFNKNFHDVVVEPITKYVSSEEIKGMSVEEVLACSQLEKK